MKTNEIIDQLEKGKKEILFGALVANGLDSFIAEEQEDIDSLASDIMDHANYLYDIKIGDVSLYEWDVKCSWLDCKAWNTNVIHVLRNSSGVSSCFILWEELKSPENLDETEVINMYNYFMCADDANEIVDEYIKELPVQVQKKLPVFLIQYSDNYINKDDNLLRTFEEAKEEIQKEKNKMNSLWLQVHSSGGGSVNIINTITNTVVYKKEIS